MEARTVLVLGGGVGGVVAAHTLRKLLPRTDRILVVDQEDLHIFQPSLLWMLVGQRRAEQITRPIARLQRKGIEFVQGRIEVIDPAKKSIRVSGREIVSDALIISLGAAFAPEKIPGLNDSGRNIYTLAGAKAISEDLRAFEGGRIAIVTAAPAYKCPGAPYESAMLIESYCRKKGIRGRTQIDLYAAEAGPMLTAGVELSNSVRKLVESKGIAYHHGLQLTEVEPQDRNLKFSDGTNAKFDLLFYVPPHKAPEVVKQAGLLSESGWIAVDRQTMKTQFNGVYAIGDVVSIPLKMGRPLPKAGVFAHEQATVVSQNIAAEWLGKEKRRSFSGRGECFIEIGEHRAGLGRGNFYNEPLPAVAMKWPGIRWHLLKVLFEKYWLWKWF